MVPWSFVAWYHLNSEQKNHCRHKNYLWSVTDQKFWKNDEAVQSTKQV